MPYFLIFVNFANLNETNHCIVQKFSKLPMLPKLSENIKWKLIPAIQIRIRQKYEPSLFCAWKG